MQLQIGDKAPEFKLYSSEKSEVSLSDYQGKNVLLLFFPLAFSGNCTKEACEVRDSLSVYNDLDTEVVAISVDSFAALAKFKSEYQLNFTFLSDFNKEVSRIYGVLYDTFVLGMHGVSKRSAFVIAKDGSIQYAEVLENAGELPNFKAIKDTIANLK